jgi:hypothetical protein
MACRIPHRVENDHRNIVFLVSVAVPAALRIASRVARRIARCVENTVLKWCCWFPSRVKSQEALKPKHKKTYAKAKQNLRSNQLSGRRQTPLGAKYYGEVR